MEFLTNNPHPLPGHPSKGLQILHLLDECVFELDQDGRVLFANEKAGKLFNTIGGEVTGANLWKAFPQLADSSIRRAIESSIHKKITIKESLFFPLIHRTVLLKAVPSVEGALVMLIETDLPAKAQGEQHSNNGATEEAQPESRRRFSEELADTKQLQQISSQLIEEDNVEELYEQIIDAAIAIMHSDTGSMQMFSSEKNELLLLAWRGLAPESASFWQRVSLDSECSCGTALRNKERIIIPDIDNCGFMQGTENQRFYRLSGIKSSQSTPLISRSGKILGMISTHWKDIHQPSERELHLLDVLARQAADLLERSRALAAVRESEQRFRSLVEANAQAVWETNAMGVVVKDSPSWRTYTGQTFEEWIGYGWSNAIHPDEREHALRQWCEAVAAGRNVNAEFRLKCASGVWRWTNLRATPILDGKGNVVKWAGMNIDIHDRKLAEEALKKSEEQVRLAMVAGKMISWEVDPATGKFNILSTYPETSGLYTENHSGDARQAICRLILPEDQPKVTVELEKTMRGEGNMHIEYRYRLPSSDDTRWIEAHAMLITTPTEPFGRVVGVAQDITERKKLEQRLKDFNETLEELVEDRTEALSKATRQLGEQAQFLTRIAQTSPNTLVVMNLKTRENHYLNDRIYSWLGISEEEYESLGYMKTAIVHPDDLPRLHQFVADYIHLSDDDQPSIEFQVRAQAGNWLWLESTGRILKRDEEGLPLLVLSTIRNVTESKKAAQELIQLKLSQQKEVLSAVLNAQEEERKRISESLHNGLGQLLYAAKMKAEVLQPDPALENQQQLKLEVDRLLKEAINQTRKISWQLSPQLLESFGLKMAIEEVVKNFQSDDLYLYYRFISEQERFAPDIEIAVFRIVQELLNNIVKHSQASIANIRIENTLQSLTITVKDDGVGFDAVEAARKKSGIGMRSIENRVKLLNGSMSIESDSESGTRIAIVLNH